jgi:hypothetical protein
LFLQEQIKDIIIISLPVTVPMAEEVPERAASLMMRSMGVSTNVVLD